MPFRWVGQEEDVEGHGLRVTDGDGNEWIIAEDRITAIMVRDSSGHEQEVEAHFLRKFEPTPEVEGHGVKVKFQDDDGEEQEVEGHGVRIH